MRRFYFALTLALCYTSLALAQTCPLVDLTISTQGEIDNFAATYPGCTDLPVSLTIQEASAGTITSLAGLAQLESIQGNLTIQSNTMLGNLSGLDNLLTISGHLSLLLNGGLVSVDGLDALTSIGAYCSITNNMALEDIDGLNSLGSVGGYFTVFWNAALSHIDGLNNLNAVSSYIHIFNNDAMTSLNGFGALTSTGSYMLIDGNDGLLAINGFNTLANTGGYLSVVNNNALQSMAGFSALTTINGFLKIQNNQVLQTLTHFQNLTSINGDLLIDNNDNLKKLDGLQNIDPAGITDLDIMSNAKLVACEVTSICNYLDTGGGHSIVDNGCGCSTMTEVEDLCDSYCLESGVVFTTQAEIDAFAGTYPGCNRIKGDVTIAEASPGAISSLAGLSQIESIIGSLTISNNTALAALTGLDQLVLITGDLSIENNSSMTNLSGLNLVKIVMGNLSFADNDLLSDLSALLNLSEIEGTLQVTGNAVLPNLIGLKHIAANSITAIEITDNPVLSHCAVASICQYLDAVGAISTISNNQTDCNNSIEIIATCEALPVELLYFKGEKAGAIVRLDWQTASELNNAGFEIHKSSDAINWTILDWMPGRGTTDLLSQYEFSDLQPSVGDNYYRLKQIDYDGAFAFSHIVNVKGEVDELDIEVFPNPSSGDLSVTVANPAIAKMKIVLYDSRGAVHWRSVLIKDEALWRKDFYLEQQGLYFLTVQIGRTVFSKKISIVDKK